MLALCILELEPGKSNMRGGQFTLKPISHTCGQNLKFFGRDLVGYQNI